MAAGGTGGHIYPALALGQKLRESHPDLQIEYCCGNRPGEIAIYRSNGIEPWILPVSGRRPGLKNTIQFLREMLASYRMVRAQIKTYRPSLAVGFGNYLSVPVLIAARRFGARTVLHEQNAHPGLANKFLGKRAELILTGVPVTKGKFPAAKTQYVGNPIREALLASTDPSEARKSLGLPLSGRVCLCFGGSLGALGVNRILKSALPVIVAKSLDSEPEVCNSSEVDNPAWNFLWATGPPHFESLSQWLELNPQLQGRVKLLPYIDRMQQAYAAADLVIARAGALTLAELTALGKPSILVPLPHSAGDHQRGNARALANAGAALVMEEGDPEAAEKLVAAIGEFSHEEGRLLAMQRAALSLGRPQAAAEMARLIESLL